GRDRRLLIQSDGQSATNPDDLITQHLLAGTYLLEVEGLGGGTGAYTISTQFEPAIPPNEPLLVNFDHDYPFGLSPWFHITGDFNGDGRPDIATANAFSNDVSVLLGLGDGTFDRARNFGVGVFPFGIAVGDFNRDGRLDLATASQLSNDVSILFGQGDGAFATEMRIVAGTGAWGLATADLN